MEIKEIKKYMKNNGITQKELSLKCNIPIGTLNSIFSGRTERPRLDTMNAITSALGLDYIMPLQPQILEEPKFINYRTAYKNCIVVYDNSGDEYQFNFDRGDLKQILNVCEALTKK